MALVFSATHLNYLLARDTLRLLPSPAVDLALECSDATHQTCRSCIPQHYNFQNYRDG
jgi:hypothetical protein